MNVLRKTIRIIALVAVVSTVICGIYVTGNKDVLTDPASSLEFHRFIGIAGALLCATALFLPAGRKVKNNG